jgi:hypothetical protein
MGLGVVLLAYLFILSRTTASAEDVYFPLAGGMEWIYKFQVVSTNGQESNGVLHRKIGEAVQHNGKTYFRSHTWLEAERPFHMDYTKLVRRDEAGFYSIDERDPKRVEKQGGRLPLEVGKKWENKVEGGVLQTTVLAKEDVTFGGRVYKNCYRIRIASPGGEYLEEFVEAPGVGSLTSKANRLDGTWIMTLQEFKPPAVK